MLNFPIELPHPKLPLILGHQVVGIIDKIGENVSNHKIGDRVGIPWLGEGSCHTCEFCISERENLCDKAIYTGYLRDGGYADYCTAHDDIPTFPYALLWGERSMSSVANLTRQDGIDFLNMVKKFHLKITVTPFLLEEANQAIAAIRNGTLEGSAVLTM